MRGGRRRRGLLFVRFRVAGRASAGEDEDAQTMLFSGRDIWRNGAFAYGGFVYAPGGLDQDGLLLKILLSGGLYRYDAENLGGVRVIGTEWLAQILPGWRIKRGDAEFKFFMGPDIQVHWLRPDDPDNKLRGRSFGLRMAAELWYEPDPDTMIAADVSLSSIATSDTARIALWLANSRRHARWRLCWPGTPIFRLGRLPAFTSRCSCHHHEDRRYRMVGSRWLGTGLRRPLKSLSATQPSETAVS